MAQTEYSATRSVARHLIYWFPIQIPIWNNARNWQVASSPMYVFVLFVTFFSYLQCFYFKSLIITVVSLCRTIRRKEANQCSGDAASVVATNAKITWKKRFLSCQRPSNSHKLDRCGDGCASIPCRMQCWATERDEQSNDEIEQEDKEYKHVDLVTIKQYCCGVWVCSQRESKRPLLISNSSNLWLIT